MFFGEHLHALDAKGRLTLPAKFRDQLSEGLMITKGEDFCLQIYPLSAWEVKQSEVMALTTASKENREYRRAFFSGAEGGELDGQGRILVKEAHRRYAGLGKECAVVGAGEFIEVWSRERWDEQLQVVEEAIGNRDELSAGRAGG